MSEGGHHHGGDMGGQQGFQPGMFPPHESHHHHHQIADPSDLTPRRSDGAVMACAGTGREQAVPPGWGCGFSGSTRRQAGTPYSSANTPAPAA